MSPRFVKQPFLLLFLLLPMTVLANSNRQFGLAHAFDINSLPYGKLRAKLESLPAPAQDKALKWLHEFSFTEQDVQYLRSDNDGGILYEDRFDGVDVAEGSPVDGQPDADLTVENVFRLHSKPGSSNVVFLDFDGHTITGTAWNSYVGEASLNARPYDLDGVPASFNSAELANIAEIWRRISEDFAAFDIDVTTEMPTVFTATTGRILITRDTDTDGKAMPAQGAGGVAYVGVWGRSNYNYYSPALVYFNRLGSGRPDYVSEASSHELGHNLNLSHDGTSTTGYYRGHGSGSISWAPLMGVGYGRNVTQWSKGEYPDSNNQQDDIAIIKGYLNERADDHPDSLQAMSRLISDAQGNVQVTTPTNDFFNEVGENKGIISSAADIDVFYFDAEGGGSVDLTIMPAHQDSYTDGGNLDIGVALYDSVGNLVASNDQAEDTPAILTHGLTNGRYYLAVQGVASTNYSYYGSQGQYFISGFIPVASNDNEAPLPDPMDWAIVPQANGRDSATMQAVTASDASGTVEYQFQCLSGGQGCVSSSWQSETSYSATGLAADTTYSFRVVARDAFINTTLPSAEVQVTTQSNAIPLANDDIASLEAGTATNIWVLSNDSDADGDTLSIVAVTQGALGSVSYNANSVSYNSSGQTGSDSFSYTIQDGYGGTATAVVSVTITAANQLPLAISDEATLTVNGGTIIIDALANDSDPDGNVADLRIVGVAGGKKGTLTTDGYTISYHHHAVNQRRFKGSDTFTYTIEDTKGGQASASVTVNFGSADSGGGGGKGNGKGKNK